jgi:hypothetical protein
MSTDMPPPGERRACFTAFSASGLYRIVVNDEVKNLEGCGLGPIEIFSENFSGVTGECHEHVNHIIRYQGPREDNYKSVSARLSDCTK